MTSADNQPSVKPGSDTERAWAAGFFDGEGYVGIRRDKRPGRTLTLQIGIEQVDIRPLLRFKAAVGWSGYPVQRPARRAPARQPIYRIIMGHQDTLRTFAAMWPWLSEPKREQFTRAMEEINGTPAVA